MLLASTQRIIRFDGAHATVNEWINHRLNTPFAVHLFTDIYRNLFCLPVEANFNLKAFCEATTTSPSTGSQPTATEEKEKQNNSETVLKLVKTCFHFIIFFRSCRFWWKGKVFEIDTGNGASYVNYKFIGMKETRNEKRKKPSRRAIERICQTEESASTMNESKVQKEE